jgi:hypothetical protein
LRGYQLKTGQNSPPSSDPNRKKDSKENDENESDSNTGGQLGHPGKTLDFFENPDHATHIPATLTLKILET